jgi:hypothetical protein
LFSLRFIQLSGPPEPSDIISINAYLNGDPDAFKIRHNPEAIAVDELSGEDISVYPNPASSYITIKAPGHAVVQIMDITGSTVYSKMSLGDETSYRMDVHDMRKGIYLVKIQHGSLTSVRKLIISH